MNSSATKHELALILFLSWSSSVLGFTIPHERSYADPTLSIISRACSFPRSGSCLSMSDFDFPSAMPEKPKLTMEEKMNQSADDFLANMDNALVDKSTAPPELEALREARKANAPASEITVKIYNLMIERAMRYDSIQ